MTHTEVLAALEEARFDARLDSRHEDLAGDERGPAELAEWGRIAQLLAGTTVAYDPDTDAYVQDELAAEAERERQEQLAAEQHCQEEQREAARRAALAPDVVRHALLRTLTATGLLEGLREDEQHAVDRLPYADPQAALTFNALLARAYEAGQSTGREAGRV
ncbi:hypothetical protein IPZ58_28300 [Streptomyces roseoverticillatus]|uniref:hypothetical protein n=1 Tax=Streptomyces roseoverticillatus TaxID=66429 RepID=UPI001F482ABD|nr:hypothetical protein [Streptomyces roseoverticillatus]MCF3105463.1 hypothetical protein [Streptomyces roseoverticillatus]